MGNALVLDFGSCITKAGLAGASEPVLIPSLVGRAKYRKAVGPAAGGSLGAGAELFFGEQAMSRRGVLALDRLIAGGRVAQWDAFAEFFEHSAEAVGVRDLANHAVLLADSPAASAHDRERLAELLFERFSVPSLFVQLQAVLSMYASGETSGIVVDCGEDLTSVVPVQDGYAMPALLKLTNVAGSAVTSCLGQLLAASGKARLTSTAEMQILREIKEKHARFGPPSPRQYSLPDGTTISLGAEAVECAELLFRSPSGGLTSTLRSVAHSLDETDVDVLDNVLVCGGCTAIPGFADRLSTELGGTLRGHAFDLSLPPWRTHAAWLGGSLVAKLSTFSSMSMSRAEYDEEGAHGIHART